MIIFINTWRKKNIYICIYLGLFRPAVPTEIENILHITYSADIQYRHTVVTIYHGHALEETLFPPHCKKSKQKHRLQKQIPSIMTQHCCISNQNCLFHLKWKILFQNRTILFLKPVLVTNLFYNLSWFLRVQYNTRSCK